ncbi:reverse transcriptase [Brachionus plicatilis]|uniref:Reverse transcriptase n=1 Tax=Brachionus plicatilis TaxID=10195 RepID=A0A3M7QIU4_BRAPC|nr:reverse transcriptase [Brachionus plicatilis]
MIFRKYVNLSDLKYSKLRFKNNKLKVFRLNINSILGNIFEMNEILNSRMFDIVCFSEFKLDQTIPKSLDRNRHGGGLLVFIKNSLKVTRTFLHDATELVYFQLKLHDQCLNFVYCYRSPKSNETQFLDDTEDFIQSLNLNDPLFVFGDLNLNCDVSKKLNNNFKNFIDNNDLVNFIYQPTREESIFAIRISH